MWSTVHLPLGHSASSTLGSFSKPWRWRWQERHQTKGLMSRTTAVHVRFESWYISLPSSAKQQCEMTKFYVFWRMQTTMANFWYLLLELNAVGACLAWANFRPIGVLNRFTVLRHSKVKYKSIFYKASSLQLPSSLLKLPNNGTTKPAGVNHDWP